MKSFGFHFACKNVSTLSFPFFVYPFLCHLYPVLLAFFGKLARNPFAKNILQLHDSERFSPIRARHSCPAQKFTCSYVHIILEIRAVIFLCYLA